MKLYRKITSFGIALAILAPTAVLAQGVSVGVSVTATTTNNDSTTTRGEKIRTLKDKVEAKREDIKERMEAKREDIKDKAKGIFSDFSKKVIERFNAAIERLDKISGRIESRIGKLEAEGVDESNAKGLLVIAKAKLDIARVSVANISIAVNNAITASSTLKMNYPAVKNVVEKAKADLKNAHRALIDVVKNIKPGKNKNQTSTSTATTTSN